MLPALLLFWLMFFLLPALYVCAQYDCLCACSLVCDAYVGWSLLPCAEQCAPQQGPSWSTLYSRSPHGEAYYQSLSFLCRSSRSFLTWSCFALPSLCFRAIKVSTRTLSFVRAFTARRCAYVWQLYFPLLFCMCAGLVYRGVMGIDFSYLKKSDSLVWWQVLSRALPRRPAASAHCSII